MSEKTPLDWVKEAQTQLKELREMVRSLFSTSVLVPNGMVDDIIDGLRSDEVSAEYREFLAERLEACKSK